MKNGNRAIGNLAFSKMNCIRVYFCQSLLGDSLFQIAKAKCESMITARLRNHLKHEAGNEKKRNEEFTGTDVLHSYYTKHSFDCQYRCARKMQCKAAGPHLTGGVFVILFSGKLLAAHWAL